MKEETLIEDKEPVSLDDKVSELMDYPGSNIATDVTNKFQRSKINRKEAEARWLKAYQNFRGRYGEDVEFRATEVSRVFVKVTKTKTLAAYGQLLDVLLGGPQFPISVSPTEKPVGVLETIHVDPATQGGETPPEEPSLEGIDPIGYEGDGFDVDPKEGLLERMKRIAAASLNIGDADVNVKEGSGGPGSITIDPAHIAAEGMTKKIQDQLTETNMPREFRKFLFEACLLGTGCIKGPFYTDKEYPMWNEEGEYEPVMSPMPMSKFASIWSIYNDPDATNVQDSEWIIERHKLSVSELRDFKKQKYFRAGAVDRAIELGASYRDESWEITLKEGNDQQSSNKFEVLEYWGTMSDDLLMELGGLDKGDLTEGEESNVSVFVCNGILLRLVVNPFKPTRIPYYVCPYEEDPYNFFGVGLPENMEDSQTLMNGFARLGVDNAVLAGNIMLEVDADNLSPDTSMDMYPGKIWKREGGNPGTTINAIQFPNTANANMMMYDKFRQLADEGTGISSFSHGQTGVSGVGRTAAGISMLMGAASGAIKTVIKNIDDYVLEPLGKAYFAWNMQFDYDASLTGDLEIKPQGVSSLMQKEVKSQRMINFIQVAAQDPEMSARINKEYLTKEIAKSLELDPRLATVSEEEFQLKIALGLLEQPQQGGVGGTPPAAPQAGVDGSVGGVPAPAMPEEAGFPGVPREGQPQ